MSGESYWSFLGKLPKGIDNNVLDCWNTLALLAGSGVLPSNNDRGYRVRKTSKELAGLIGYDRGTVDFFSAAYERWSLWTKLPKIESEARDIVMKELDRNTNAFLKGLLEVKGFRDVGIDLNLPADEFIRRLRGTSVRKENLIGVLKSMNYEQ